jgi:VanZ family protein
LPVNWGQISIVLSEPPSGGFFFGVSMPYRKIALVIWALAMGTVTVLALLPIRHLELPVFDWWDKAQHVFAFVVLTGGALLLWPGASARVVIGMITYGAGIEWAQWAVGWRFAEWADLAADTVGVVGAWLLVSGFQRVRVNKSGG